MDSSSSSSAETSNYMYHCAFDYDCSVRQLKRHLKRIGLKRRNNWRLEEIQVAVQEELDNSGKSLGCRSLTRRLSSSHGIFTGRDTVLQLQHLLDPIGVQMRSRHCLKRREYFNKGPNWLVHIDGYDKLKRYGFPVHGAICGFSRRMLWLRTARSNNDPRVVASYYLDYVRDIEGVPRCIRMDAGTENGHIADMQKAFRWNHDDDFSGERSVIIGSSTSNQRIESWWRQLRQMDISYWMDFFLDMESNGLYSTANQLHIEICRFCFMPIIQAELDRIRHEWNRHEVRRTTHGTVAGKPDMLFYHPDLYGTDDFKHHVDLQDVECLMPFCSPPSTRGCTDDVYDRCTSVLQEYRMEQPRSASEAKNMLTFLISNIQL